MEFHAFVLCGPGKALSPFSTVRSTGIPKALLPVANRPMIETVLDWCESAFFPKVTLVVDPESREDFEQVLNEYQSKLKKYVAQTSPAEDPYKTEFDILELECESSGTIFHYLNQHRLQHPNFVFLPCDLVTNLPPQVFIEAFRNRNERDVGMLVHYRNSLQIEDKKNRIFPQSYTFYSDNDELCTFLDNYSTEDVEFHKSLKIRTQMSWRYPTAIISKKLLNASIFFGTSELLSIFDTSDKFSESYFGCRLVLKVIRDVARRSWKHSSAKETIAFMVVPEIASFYRINNTHVLMEANRAAMQKQAKEKAQQGPPAPREKNAANVGIDSLVGADTVLGERTNVKKTVIGNGCKIGKRVKLTGTLILNNVVIEDDVQLENCIIGSGVTIGLKARLTNCNVEAKHEISHGTQAKGETLMSFSLEGIADDDMESDSSDEYSEYSDEDSEERSDIEFDDNLDGLFDH